MLKVCCNLYDARCWKWSSVWLTLMQQRRQFVVTSLYVNAFHLKSFLMLHILVMKVCESWVCYSLHLQQICQLNSYVPIRVFGLIVLVRELKNCTHTWDFVCVWTMKLETCMSDGFVLVDFFVNMYDWQLENFHYVWIHAWASTSVDCCHMSVISTWKSWFCLQRWKEDVDRLLHENV